MGNKDKPDSYSDKEAAKRRDEIVKRMLATPPKPFTATKRKKAKSSKSK